MPLSQANYSAEVNAWVFGDPGVGGILPTLTKVGNNFITVAIEIQSTSAAFCNARMTTAQLAAGTFVPGCQAFNTDVGALQVYQNGGWQTTSNVQFVTGSLTNANILAMEAAPVAIPALAAPGAGKMIVIHNWSLNLIYGTVQLANGGAISLQYGNTAAALGPLASASIPAAALTPAANSYMNAESTIPAVLTTANTVNTAIYITNATAPFITGSAGTSVNYTIWYSVISVS